MDGDGKITRDELSQVLNGNNVKSALGADKIERMINEVDINGDGCLDFEEFVAMMEPSSASSPAKRRRTDQTSLLHKRGSLTTDTLERH